MILGETLTHVSVPRMAVSDSNPLCAITALGSNLGGGAMKKSLSTPTLGAILGVSGACSGAAKEPSPPLGSTTAKKPMLSSYQEDDDSEEEGSI